jgi:mannose-6-phosphate isomerase-like protein (cupin superfamily)
MMRVLHKSWGVKTELFKNDLCEVSVLSLNPGQRCSWHRHRSKWNQFYVLEGSIAIKTEDGETVVRKGQVFTTNPLQWHEFQTPDGPALVQEIMYVKYECEDIERTVKGGRLGESVCDHDWADVTELADEYYISHCPKCGEWKRTPKARKTHDLDYLPTSQIGGCHA